MEWAVGALAAAIVAAGGAWAQTDAASEETAAQPRVEEAAAPGLRQRRESLEHEGWERWWIAVDARPEAEPAPAPLLVVLHGGGRGGPERIRRVSGFDGPAVSAGMIVAYPSGLSGEGGRTGWNDGRLGEDGRPLEVWDDVGFLSAMIERMIDEGRVDPEHVYVAGVSNGGMMAMRLACERPDLLTAVALLIANTPEGAFCADARPVPALLLHGDEDEIMPYYGGLVAQGLIDRGVELDQGAVRSAPDTVASWSARNGCAAPGPAVGIDDAPDGTFVEIRDYLDCAAPLRQILVAGGGHTLPKLDPNWRGRWLAERFLGPVSEEIETADAVLDFFKEIGGYREVEPVQ